MKTRDRSEEFLRLLATQYYGNQQATLTAMKLCDAMVGHWKNEHDNFLVRRDTAQKKGLKSRKAALMELMEGGSSLVYASQETLWQSKGPHSLRNVLLEDPDFRHSLETITGRLKIPVYKPKTKSARPDSPPRDIDLTTLLRAPKFADKARGRKNPVPRPSAALAAHIPEPAAAPKVLPSTPLRDRLEQQMFLQSLCHDIEGNIDTAWARCTDLVSNWRKTSPKFNAGFITIAKQKGLFLSKEELDQEILETDQLKRLSPEQTIFLNAFYHTPEPYDLWEVRSAWVDCKDTTLSMWCKESEEFRTAFNKIAYYAKTGEVTDSPPYVIGDYYPESLGSRTHAASAGSNTKGR